MENEVIESIPQDLQGKISALKALTTVHSLLVSGLFQVKHHEIINESMKFISSLHAQVMAEASSHPDADLVPELKAHKNQENTNV